AGKEPARATSAGPADRHPRRAVRMAAIAECGRQRARIHLLCHRGAHRHIVVAAANERSRHRLQRPQHQPELAGRHLREPGQRAGMSVATQPLIFPRHAVWAIYKFEMARAKRTLLQSLVTPVITTSLYFVVFGAAIGSRVKEVGGVSYGAFIVPGLIMLSLFTQSMTNASF